MKQVQSLLTAVFWIGILIAVIIVCVCETGLCESGTMAGRSSNTEFIVTTVMELLTMLCIPVSLKMFKFKRISKDLISRKADALRQWGLLRLLLLIGLMVVNTLLYYIYMKPAFGYMALITVLCLPFVYPSKDRCLTETEEA